MTSWVIMIKILHLQNELNLTCGITRTISQIINHTSSEFEHHIITFGGDGVARINQATSKIIVLDLNYKTITGTIKVFLFIKKYIKENKINIIHAHHRYFDAISNLLNKIVHVKTLCSVQSKVTGWKRISYKTEKIIACSNAVKVHLMDYFNIKPDRIDVIYNMVDLSTVNSSVVNKKCDPAPNGEFVIGFAGRMDIKEKGVDLLIEAYNQVKNEYPNIKLLMTGNGPDAESIKNLIRKSPEGITLLSAQKNIEEFFNIIDLFVLPSRVEPFGIVLIEAGLMNKPVIASNVDGIPEIISDKNNGLLFPTGNIDKLKSLIIKLLNDENARKKLAYQLNKKVIENYTADRIIPKYKSIYRELVSGKT